MGLDARQWHKYERPGMHRHDADILKETARSAVRELGKSEALRAVRAWKDHDWVRGDEGLLPPLLECIEEYSDEPPTETGS